MIPQSEFHAIIRAVAHGASSDKTRQNLDSVLFEFLEDSMRIVSTDGHRLTIATLNIIAPSSGIGNFLAPMADIKELLGVFKYKSDKRISFARQGDTLIVENGKATLLVGNTPYETFPDYRQVLPDGDICDASVDHFNSEYISQAIKACSGLINDVGTIGIIKRAGGIPMTLRPVLDLDLEVLQALDIYIMPMWRDT